MFGSKQRDYGQTWTTVKGDVYGAKPDQRGPIGGGVGYKSIVTTGDYVVSTLDELLDALAAAKAGEVVFIDGRAEIDCTVRVYIDELVLDVPAGVTLASNRGEGKSRGALICSDTFKTRPLIRPMGPGVRVTGLRLRGPNPKVCQEHHHRCFNEGRGHKYYYKFPVSVGIHGEHDRLEVDNCEMAGWSLGAVNLKSGRDHHIHHCFIHHNQYNGLGYGVCHCNAVSLIERNLFDYNRHSIAGTGEPGCGYEARNNLEIRHSLSHCFDMHGGSDRQDGTNIAGDRVGVHHNTFRTPGRTPVVIRGEPTDEVLVHHNWFLHHKPAGEPHELAVRAQEKTRVRDNAYGAMRPKVADQEG